MPTDDVLSIRLLGPSTSFRVNENLALRKEVVGPIQSHPQVCSNWSPSKCEPRQGLAVVKAGDMARHLRRPKRPLLQGIVSTGDIPICSRYQSKPIHSHLPVLAGEN
jgi:hypothetical protein